jgi:hypothetical protein
MRPHDWLPALLTAFWATCSFACTVPLDLRPSSQRLADDSAGLHRHRDVGVGTARRRLRSITPSTARRAQSTAVEALAAVHVLHRLRRWPAAALCGTGDEPAVGPAPCQRAQLRRRTDFGRLRRADDARAQFPAAWQACTANAQCEPVPIGCQRTAANAANVTAARAQSMKILGDHRAMECATPPQEIQPLASPQCIASRCGHWFLDLRLGV